MRLLYLGSLTSIFSWSYVQALSESGFELSIINTSKEEHFENLFGIEVLNIYPERRNKRIWFFIKKIIKYLKIDTSILFIKYLKFLEKEKVKEFENNMVSYIADINPGVCFSFWGTCTFNEIEVIKEHFPNIKVILDINTYPVREKIKFDEIGEFINDDMRVFNQIDGLIFTSEIMKDYFSKYINLERKKNIIFYDSFISKLYSTEELTINDEDKLKLVFLGNTEFKNRTIDDVRSQIYDLANRGIEIFVQEPAVGLLPHKNINIFKTFSFDEIYNGELGKFISKFDGIIVFYNDFNDLRTNISIPTRFSLGLCGRIPIIIEKGKFLAIEEIFSIKENLYLYNNIDEIITDFKVNKTNYKNNAFKFSNTTELENRMGLLNSFILNI